MFQEILAAILSFLSVGKDLAKNTFWETLIFFIVIYLTKAGKASMY